MYQACYQFLAVLLQQFGSTVFVDRMWQDLCNQIFT